MDLHRQYLVVPDLSDDSNEVALLTKTHEKPGGPTLSAPSSCDKVEAQRSHGFDMEEWPNEAQNARCLEKRDRLHIVWSLMNASIPLAFIGKYNVDSRLYSCLMQGAYAQSQIPVLASLDLYWDSHSASQGGWGYWILTANQLVSEDGLSFK